jgi:hypothetical protein
MLDAKEWKNGFRYVQLGCLPSDGSGKDSEPGHGVKAKESPLHAEALAAFKEPGESSTSGDAPNYCGDTSFKPRWCAQDTWVGYESFVGLLCWGKIRVLTNDVWFFSGCLVSVCSSCCKPLIVDYTNICSWLRLPLCLYHWYPQLAIFQCLIFLARDTQCVM